MSTPHDTAMEDANQEAVGGTEGELDRHFPNRPKNFAPTLPFHELYTTVFNPLNDNKKKPIGPHANRRRAGPHGPHALTPHEIRRQTIERFISRWRSKVGNDIYPAFRLMVPEKDRDRAMYGLKEKAIGKLLIKVMKINKDSEDGYALLNWKIPGQTAASRMAGDFGGRCFEILSKRPMRTTVGDMTMQEVNDELDRLAGCSLEKEQLPVFEHFYSRMCPEELMWLIRIILRQMKVGATERTFFDIWHPDAESLFNVSSSLKRVCWELFDPQFRLEQDERGITLMQCFQPQLAQFQMNTFQRMVERLRPTEDDATYWIEEKLDGERMQLHMITDASVPGGKKFVFWSRKAKDYTYLYGSSLHDDTGALTRHLADAFDQGVRNLILDGEMITWDPQTDTMLPFGTLKTAALAAARSPYDDKGPRPLLRVFDMLYLNDKALTQYTLRDRRRALEAAVKGVDRRLEIHGYTEAASHTAIEPCLREVVAQSSEGLVLKNPRAAYALNQRNDDWMKVKPEYMTEYGESLDLLIIGGYYGSGTRGGGLSSFLCGLKLNDTSEKCWSFCKVGGGFTKQDYDTLKELTDGKWTDWNKKRPPTEFIELGGGSRQFECPDRWIRPKEGIVIAIKAASVSNSDQFRTGFTLRFPRFMRIREDKNFASALTIDGFRDLQRKVESEKKEHKFEVDTSRKAKRAKVQRKRPLTIAGSVPLSDDFKHAYAGSGTDVFKGMNFFVVTDAGKPIKKSKADLEALIKAHGGKIWQVQTAAPDMVCIADKRVVKVAAMQKAGNLDVVRPSWVLDCIRQAECDAERCSPVVLPYEMRHMLHLRDERKGEIKEHTDEWGDSFARDVDVSELQEIFAQMPKATAKSKMSHSQLCEEMEARQTGLGEGRGWMFAGLTLCFVTHPEAVNAQAEIATMHAQFAGAKVSQDIEDESVTHVVVANQDRDEVKELRSQVSRRPRLPRLVTLDWIEQCWKEGTRLDEERFSVH